MNEEPRELRLQNEAMQRCQAAILKLVMVCYNIMLTQPAGWRGSRPVQLRHRENPTVRTAWDHLWAWEALPDFSSIWENLATLMDEIRNLPAGASAAALIRYNPAPRFVPQGVNRQYRRALVYLADTLTTVPELGSSWNDLRLVWNNTMIQGLCILARDTETNSATKAVLSSMFVASMEIVGDTPPIGGLRPYAGVLTEGSE